eukprot:569363-Prymnesium_polylepis.1
MVKVPTAKYSHKAKRNGYPSTPTLKVAIRSHRPEMSHESDGHTGGSRGLRGLCGAATGRRQSTRPDSQTVTTVPRAVHVRRHTGSRGPRKRSTFEFTLSLRFQ